MFTHIFAAVVGRAVKNCATWKLEQGVTLGHLEQLMESRTLPAAVNTQISLRTFGPLGTGLLLIWALSPLGSRSPLRVLSSCLTATAVNQTVYYVDTLANDMFFGADAITDFMDSLREAAYGFLIS